MIRGWRACAVAFAAGGCDQVFSVDHIEGPDAPAGVSLCAADDFSGGSINPMWTVSGVSAGVVTSSDADELRIDVPAATTADQDPYGGIRSPAFDLTGGSVEVELRGLPPPASYGGAFLTMTFDNKNHYDLLVQQGKAVARSYVDAVLVDMPEVYNAALHHVLRLRHDAATNEIVWESHGDGTEWHQLRRETFAFATSVLTVSAIAGSFEISPAYTVRFDNLVLYGRCTH